MRAAQVDRFERALVNRAFSALGQAESAWQSLASQHADTEAGAMVRDIALRMHACREVLTGWTEV